MCRAQENVLFFGGVGILIRIFEKAEIVFELQDAEHRFVDACLINLAALHEVLQVPGIAAGHHIHINAGAGGLPGSITCILCIAVGDQLGNRREIRDQHTVKAELLPQDLLHKPFVSGGRNVIYRIEAAHHHAGTGVNGSAVGRKIVIPERPLAELYRVVFPAGLGAAISCKVLHAGRNFAGFLYVIALEPLYHGRCEQAVQVRILTGGFHNASPACIPHQIHHGCKGDVQAACGRLIGGSRGAFLGQLRIKGSTLCQRCRENGLQTVNDIHHEQQRNVVRLYGHGLVLDGLELLCAIGPENAPGRLQILQRNAELLSRSRQRTVILLRKKRPHDLEHLVNLLLKAHILQ